MKIPLLLLLLLAAGVTAAESPFTIKCGNLVYSMDEKTSVCFADAFLREAAKQTSLKIQTRFEKLKLAGDEFFSTPFCVFTGTGDFKLSEKERSNFQTYLKRGGFVVASPGCSNAEWSAAFQREVEGMFPGLPMKTIPMTHPIFDLVHKVPRLDLAKSHGTTMLRGLEIDGRLALVFSREGLNDAHHSQGCCCCGGNEIVQSMLVNINLLVYALLY